MTTPVVHCLWQKISESNLILTLNPVFIQLEAFGLSCISDVHRRCSHTVRMDPPPPLPVPAAISARQHFRPGSGSCCCPVTAGCRAAQV